MILSFNAVMAARETRRRQATTVGPDCGNGDPRW